jgi:hypothetical protein
VLRLPRHHVQWRGLPLPQVLKSRRAISRAFREFDVTLCMEDVQGRFAIARMKCAMHETHDAYVSAEGGTRARMGMPVPTADVIYIFCSFVV